MPALALAGLGAIPGHSLAATPEIPKRRLGPTNEMVSLVALGGYHIGKADLPDEDAIKSIHAATDRGITFMDNAWDCNSGNS